MSESSHSVTELATLRELALRMLNYTGDPDQTKLLVGQVSGALPPEAGLPEGSRVLGSVEQQMGHTSILFDIALSPEDVVAFYRTRMEAAGWSAEQPFTQGGFAHGAMRGPTAQLQFCRSRRGPALDVMAYHPEEQATQVRIKVHTDARNSPCAHRDMMRQQHKSRLIPDLTPPPGARQTPQGGGGSNRSWHSEATLETDLDLAAIATHYAPQLERAGWTPIDAGQDHFISWRTWTFQDDEGDQWRGLFVVLDWKKPPRTLFLQARIDLDEESYGGASQSWVTYGST
jgi:hypothetical protein